MIDKIDKMNLFKRKSKDNINLISNFDKMRNEISQILRYYKIYQNISRDEKRDLISKIISLSIREEKSLLEIINIHYHY